MVRIFHAAGRGKKWAIRERETLVVALGAAIAFLLLTQFGIQGYEAEGRCMEPRLYTGERVLGDKLTFRRRPPRRGDVVIFQYPLDPRQLYIKRVVALGGETVEIRDGKVMINGQPLAETYLQRAPHGSFAAHEVVLGSVFMLGDNRDASDDSRHWGDVDQQTIVARAWLRYWPLRRCAAPF